MNTSPLQHKKKMGLLTYFPVPKILTMPAINLEITQEAIRFIEIIDTERGFRVGKYGTVPVPDSALSDDLFPDTDVIKKLVAEVRDKNSISLVHVAVPEEKTYLFRAEFPQLPDRELRESIELKLEEFVPIPTREAVFDYNVERIKESDRLDVSVSVMPHTVVSRYLDLFTSLQITPLSFQVSAQAVANAIIPADNTVPTIIVNFGSRRTGLYLVSGRTVCFTSTVTVGGATLTEAIKKYFSVDDREAEKIKIERGITRRTEDTELFFSMANTLSVLKDEVEKLVGYWDSHRDRYSESKDTIGSVIICGVEASTQGLPEYLEASLGIPTRLADVWTNLFSFDSYVPPIPRLESLGYASVIGLTKP